MQSEHLAGDVISAAKKAEILIESLPWIQGYTGETVVIKYGGNAMIDDDLRKAVMQDILFLHAVGIKVVVIHGGGPQISKMLDKLGIESKFAEGFRVTTPEAMDVVRMVLTGKVSRELVGLINENSFHDEGLAIGMSGEDGHLFRGVRKTLHGDDDDTIELGLVGDITKVDPKIVHDLLDSNHIPVISSIASNIDNSNEALNINADIAASELAISLNAKKLIILTDVKGLYNDYPDESSLISRIGTDNLRSLLPKLQSGMIPKMSACLKALESGVGGAHIIDGTEKHSILTEVFTTRGTGTFVTFGNEFVLAKDEIV